MMPKELPGDGAVWLICPEKVPKGVTFKLGEETYFFSDLNRLMSGSLTMHLLRCETCGKVEFFIPDAKELEILNED